MKKYQTKVQGFLVVYIDNEFGVFTLIEIMQLYSNADKRIKNILEQTILKMEGT